MVQTLKFAYDAFKPNIITHTSAFITVNTHQETYMQIFHSTMYIKQISYFFYFSFFFRCTEKFRIVENHAVCLRL